MFINTIEVILGCHFHILFLLCVSLALFLLALYRKNFIWTIVIFIGAIGIMFLHTWRFGLGLYFFNPVRDCTGDISTGGIIFAIYLLISGLVITDVIDIKKLLKKWLKITNQL